MIEWNRSQIINLVCVKVVSPHLGEPAMNDTHVTLHLLQLSVRGKRIIQLEEAIFLWINCCNFTISIVNLFHLLSLQVLIITVITAGGLGFQDLYVLVVVFLELSSTMKLCSFDLLIHAVMDGQTTLIVWLFPKDTGKSLCEADSVEVFRGFSVLLGNVGEDASTFVLLGLLSLCLFQSIEPSCKRKHEFLG
jgi:hypothetical protein